MDIITHEQINRIETNTVRLIEIMQEITPDTQTMLAEMLEEEVTSGLLTHLRNDKKIQQLIEDLKTTEETEETQQEEEFEQPETTPDTYKQ